MPACLPRLLDSVGLIDTVSFCLRASSSGLRLAMMALFLTLMTMTGSRTVRTANVAPKIVSHHGAPSSCTFVSAASIHSIGTQMNDVDLGTATSDKKLSLAVLLLSMMVSVIEELASCCCCCCCCTWSVSSDEELVDIIRAATSGVLLVTIGDTELMDHMDRCVLIDGER